MNRWEKVLVYKGVKYAEVDNDNDIRNGDIIFCKDGQIIEISETTDFIAEEIYAEVGNYGGRVLRVALDGG